MVRLRRRLREDAIARRARREVLSARLAALLHRPPESRKRLEPSMASHHIATALERVETILERRPDSGIHEDSPAVARWLGGVRVASEHGNGTRIESDMA